MLRDAKSFHRIVIDYGRTDLRRGIDGLAAIIRVQFQMNPSEKNVLFLFCGTRLDRIKGLAFEGAGYQLLYKRLAAGKFQWPRTPQDAGSITQEQFVLLMNGMKIISTIREESERTVSRYIKKLQQDYNLKKSPNPRDYEAVQKLPAGQQVQVDFGQTVLENVEGGTTGFYVAAVLQLHSRYKYTEPQSRAFTSVDLVKICHRCLRYFGGMPQVKWSLARTASCVSARTSVR